MRRLALALLALAAPSPASEPPPAPPSVYVVALPAAVSLVAWLPAPAKDLIDLDLRTEVVLPNNCGDRVAGLLKRDGARLDGAEVYDVVLERKAVGECKKEATRVGARWAIRMRVPDGAERPLQIGERTLKVKRDGKAVTLDGEGPTGDVPGAPPTAKPATLLAGTVTSARFAQAWLVPGQPGYTAVAELEVTSQFPKCAGPPIGLLGRGDAASRFALVHFDPLALAPLDGSCKAAGRPRPAALRLVVRGAPEIDVTVGKERVKAKLPAPPEAKK